MRILFLTLLLVFLSASPIKSADPPANFAPEFFAFENGVVRIGATEEQIKVLKELGYDSLGSAKPHNLPARLRTHQEAGLRISSLYIGGKIDGNKDVQTINPAIPEAIRQLKGHDTIIELFVQGSQKNTDDEAVAFVREVADLAKASGLRVVLYPHSGFYVDTLGDAVRIAKLSNRDNVGVMFNLCHFLKVEPKSDLRETLENAGDRLWRISTSGADVEGTNWGALIQPLDKGSFDQASFLRMLREIGFSGDVGLQCYSVPGDPKENLSRSILAWRKHLAKSLEE
jgi:sugar phosphate isomerase/epimerase